MNIMTRLLVSEERQAEMRLDVAARRQALTNNAVIYGTRHAQALLAYAQPALSAASTASLGNVMRALAHGETWTDGVARQLRPVIAALRRLSGRTGAGDNARGETLAWHLDRLEEILQQYEVLRHRAAMLAMSSTVQPRRNRPSARAQRIRASVAGWRRATNSAR